MKKVLSVFLVLIMMFSLCHTVMISFAADYTPAKVTGVTVNAGYKTMKVSWNKMSSATYFNILKYSSSTKKYSVLETSTTNSCTIKNLKSDTSYSVAVQAVRVVKGKTYKGTKSSIVTVKTSLTPKQVAGVKVVSKTSNSAKISWKSNLDVTGYIVYKYSSSTGKYTSLGKTTSTSKTVTGLKANTTYKIAVSAYLTINGKTYIGKKSALVTLKTNPKKVYKIVTDTTFMPFEYYDEKGESIGIDIDIMKAIAADQGFEYVMNAVGWDASIAMCNCGAADGMIAGASITDERIDNGWIFSDVYYIEKVCLVVKSNSNVNSLSGMKGKTIGAINGTSAQDLLNDLKKTYNLKVKIYESTSDMINAVKKGSISGFFDSYAYIKSFIKNENLSLKTVSISDSIAKNYNSKYAFVIFDKSNNELIKMFNAGLKNIKANGKYDKIIKKYLG